MHLVPEYGFLEILDENDEPVGPDEEGYFVWTGFLNRRHAADPLPHRRSRTLARATDPCACGRAFPLVVPTITRESDILRCPDGRLFSPRALNQLLKQSTSLRFCQFVHDAASRVVVRAVPCNETTRTGEMMAYSRATCRNCSDPAWKSQPTSRRAIHPARRENSADRQSGAAMNAKTMPHRQRRRFRHEPGHHRRHHRSPIAYGFLTSTSLMANMPAADYAIARVTSSRASASAFT